MCKQGRTIYYFARIQANLSRESVSNSIDISMESLGAYERGETKPPTLVVAKMVELYGDQLLALQHCSNCCAVGKTWIPQIEQSDEPMAVLKMQKEITEAVAVFPQLIAAVSTGATVAANVAKEFIDVIAASLSWRFSGKRKTASVTSTDSLRVKTL